MLTQDKVQVDQANLDKLFMASHDMSKYTRAIPEDKIKEYFDSAIPYYNDKELTFWAANLGKSNIYHSHLKGENAFARSSGFTQVIGQTKSAAHSYGYVTSDSTSKNVFIQPDSKEFERVIENNRQRVEEMTSSIRFKFLSVMYKKGWLGVRKYKQFLLNLSKRKNSIIEKSDFKFYSTNFGVYFTDNEVDFIFNVYDMNKSNKICFEAFVEGLIKVIFILKYSPKILAELKLLATF